GIGMIPEGLFLLTTVALSMGAVRLARKRTVTKDLYSIESLARVDILCLDKTGTLTEGRMHVEKTVPFVSEEIFNESFRQLLSALQAENATAEALTAHFGKASSEWKYEKLIPFSSQRKCSGVQFEEQGLLMFGAAQILCRKDARLLKEITPYAQEGLRVLVLCRSEERVLEDLSLPENVECLGYVLLSDVLRNDCRETLDFFKKQDVKLLCISGDDAVAVSRIASRAGLEHAEDFADLSQIKDDEALREAVRTKTVFGRVTPEQKKRIIRMLKEDGHTVAMTGDGVNDVLAMKEADCSIAMASGSEVTKHTANVVLLDSDFAAMPSIVNEGRRVINNIMNASSMYLIKTIFSAILTLGTIILGGAYPVDAVHLTVISATAVGAPTFFMQFEPTFTRIRNDFMVRVFRNAVPAALLISLVCLLVTRIGTGIGQERDVLVTICFLAIGMIYFFMLRRIYSPLSKYRKVIAYSMEIIYIIIVFVGRDILSLKAIPFAGIILILAVIALTPPFIELLEILYDKAAAYINKKGAANGQENTVV
ncbi:MAG: HAD-IC family P-type ATPase, partial [Lachnospiraceae bacterium]|nr:HAD-IC family P-type ATPase [Lachnospiraceae bacterium]